MIERLALFVVLPMVIAQLLRLARSLGRWATQHTVALSTTAQLGILCIIFFGSVQAAHPFDTTGGPPGWVELAAVIVVVLGIHITVLLTGMMVAKRLGMTRPDQIAVGFAGGQKTLAVGLQICLELGFNILPVVTFHVAQLLVDTLIADRLRGLSPGTTRDSV